MNQPSEAIINGLPFTQTIKAFNKVVEACFGLKLDPAYKAAIAEFRRLYLELDISVTPKVNIKLENSDLQDICNLGSYGFPAHHRVLGYCQH